MNQNVSTQQQKSQEPVKPENSTTGIVSHEESQTNPPQVKRSISQRILRRFQSQHYSRRRPNHKVKRLSTIQDHASVPIRALSRRDKIVHVIANPDTLFKQSKPSTPSDASWYDALVS
jgi:hypothetical protein